MKIIKGDLILEKDTIFETSIKVEGNILCKDGNKFNLEVNGNIDCGNIDCENINCGNIDCENINFYAVAVAYNSFRCKSAKSRRDNFILKCLDKEIEYKEAQE